MIKVELELKPIPIPLIYQPIHKLVMLLAILKYGGMRGQQFHVLALHVYMWALRSKKNQTVLKDLQTDKRRSLVPWSFEPGLDVVISLAIINNYCIKELVSNEFRVKLTESGNFLLNEVEQKNIFILDINKIKDIGKISKAKLDQANKNWELK